MTAKGSTELVPVLWVDFANPEDRDYPENLRFGLQVVYPNGEFTDTVYELEALDFLFATSAKFAGEAQS